MGPVGGPGQALAGQYEEFLACFGRSRPARTLLYFFARWTGFWLKYCDLLLTRNAHAMHCSSGLYFLGRRAGRALTDVEVIELSRARC